MANLGYWLKFASMFRSACTCPDYSRQFGQSQFEIAFSIEVCYTFFLQWTIY
jgi:hypothetical protein